MGLPREIIDEIMRYNSNDSQTLANCSLTSKAFYSAVRPLIHKRIVLGATSVIRGSPPEDLPSEVYLEQADAFHAHYLSIAEELGFLRYGYVREVHLDLSFGTPEKVLQLQELRTLDTVHTLTINSLDLGQILPIFDRCFSQFVPTLRSLRLQATVCNSAFQLMKFVCRFPHLDDLALISPRGPKESQLPNVLARSGRLQKQQRLPFGGDLVLHETGPTIQCLLELPGGIRFRSIEVDSYLKDLTKLLVACQPTLEDLRIRCFESSESNTLTLTLQSTEGSSVANQFCPQNKGFKTFPSTGVPGG